MRYRLCILILLLATLTACGSSPDGEPGMAVAVARAAEPQPARLLLQPTPGGAWAIVDGRSRGATPLELTLEPGEHQVVLSAPGYARSVEDLYLLGGETRLHAPQLLDTTSPAVTLECDPLVIPFSGRARLYASASDNVAVVELQLLLGGQLLIAEAGAEASIDIRPAELGMRPGSTYTVIARAADAAGNGGQASLRLTVDVAGVPTVGLAPLPSQTPSPTTIPPSTTPTWGVVQDASPTPTATFTVGATWTSVPPTVTPSPTSSPSATPTPTSGPATPTPSPTARRTPTPPGPSAATNVTVCSVEQIEIPTYPYHDFLEAATDPDLGDYPLWTLDRAAYDASPPQPSPVTYDLLVLENRYVRLSFLPDLGGRLYECIFKPTGHNELYRNPVIKPTNWGPARPAGANWWLAAGGLEWGFPVEEHGYEWATRWGYETKTFPDGSASVTLYARDGQVPYAAVTVTLPPDSAAFTVEPSIVNGPDEVFRFKWWDSAMLAPGAANEPGPDLHLVLPADQVTVHSSGDESLPEPGEAMSWPIYNGRDMSRLGNWDQWLGVFERPAAAGGFAGVYDTTADEGMMRIFPADTARGSKIFGVGWSTPVDWQEWTDDGSGYVELHGGLMPTFDDWAELGPGERISWRETWFPAAHIGLPQYATEAGALHLSQDGPSLRIGLFSSRPARGRLEVRVGDIELAAWEVDLAPDRPLAAQIAFDVKEVPERGLVSIVLTDAGGEIVLSYATELDLRSGARASASLPLVGRWF